MITAKSLSRLDNRNSRNSNNNANGGIKSKQKQGRNRNNKKITADNPVPIKTTTRPLDGFLQKHTHKITQHNEETNSQSTETIVEYTFRPSPQSYSRQSRYATTSQSLSSSTITAADAHYAKAIRLLSSPFDQLINGGNALPHQVYGGMYGGQDGRGEGFVKMEDWSGYSGGGVMKRKKKKRRRRRDEEEVMKESKKGSDGEEVGDESASVVYEVRDIVSDYVLDAMDWILDIMGVEWDLEESIADVTNDRYYSDFPDIFSRRKKNDEDVYSWRETRVGKQLVWIYTRVVKGLWTRESCLPSSTTTSSSPSSKPSFSGEEEKMTSTTFLSKEDELAREGLYHLEKAADLGHSEAQRMLANSLASGILPISDHGLVRRVAAWQFSQQQQEAGPEGKSGGNWTDVLRASSLEVPDDFSSGGEQLARAVMLWHVSAMDGNIESAMALGYRHLYSASGGTSTSLTDIVEGRIAPNYHPLTGKGRDQHGSNPTSHYGVLGTCETALAYYEAAANGVMDSLEAGPTKGKVNPPLDEHRLAEIYMHGGASVSLQGYNKPDEIEEALQYYRMLASRNHSPEPDLGAAFTIANFYYLGLRGVKQQLHLALKYYEICGDYNHWEGGGQAGLMHFWGIGMSHNDRDLRKAYKYFQQGTPGGLEGCNSRVKRRRKALNNKESAEEISLCDKHSINGMGLMHLFGVEGLVERDLAKARSWWELCKDMGDSDCQYNYGMLRLGWMVTELKDQNVERFGKDANVPKMGVQTGEQINYMTYRRGSAEKDVKTYTGPSRADYNVALQELSRAAAKGHLQAKHKLAMLSSTGVGIPTKEGKTTIAAPQMCENALKHYKSIADAGETISKRNRAGWKQYNAGDYESSLRNYLATAETGSVTGQVNAAFLLEQGYCLGMTRDSCTRASVRLWRAAARQGNLEACLRVGDYYYYGRMKKSSDVRSSQITVEENGNLKFLYEEEQLEGKAFYFVPGPYQWTRYILYPEELFHFAKKWITNYLELSHDDIITEDQTVDSNTQTCSIDESSGICEAAEEGANEEDGEEHMAIAAQYYRKAAEEHKSARANFNLGFMHEWGLGLTQDFPLAKRHYDLAGEEASIASSIALWAMSIHQRVVKLTMMMDAIN